MEPEGVRNGHGAVDRVGAEAGVYGVPLAKQRQEKQAMRLELEKLRRAASSTSRSSCVAGPRARIVSGRRAQWRHAVDSPVGTVQGRLPTPFGASVSLPEASPATSLTRTYTRPPRDANRRPGPGSPSTIACGATDQGQPVRRILVTGILGGDSAGGGGIAGRRPKTIREVTEDPALELPLGEDPVD